MLLSGDTHKGELNAIPWSQRGGYDFYDLVSSPLAQPPLEINPNRKPEARIRRVFTREDNFGLLEFDMTGDPELTFVGRLIAQGMMIHHVANRMRIHRDLAQYPEILAGELRRPLFVVGLPRTGTTLLYNLLSRDTTSRHLLFWESMSPSPPPDPGELVATLREKIENALPGATVDVRAESPGHFSISVVSAAFEGHSRVKQQQLVYGAIADLMAGDAAPVHAIDRLVTRTP